jgi:hypothetical protein
MRFMYIHSKSGTVLKLGPSYEVKFGYMHAWKKVFYGAGDCPANGHILDKGIIFNF